LQSCLFWGESAMTKGTLMNWVCCKEGNI
jgi:hypothetical protein